MDLAITTQLRFDRLTPADLEAHVFHRAVKGDAQLAMFLLRAHRPAVYRETSRIDVGLLGGIIQIPAKAEGPE